MMCINGSNLTPVTVRGDERRPLNVYIAIHVSRVWGLHEVIQGRLHMEPFILDRRPCLVFTALKASAEEV